MISITHLKALWDPQSSIRVKRSSETKKLESTDLEPASLDGACVCLRKDASSGWTEPIPGARSGQGRAGWISSLFLPLAGHFETCTNFPTVRCDPVFLGCPNWCLRLQLASSLVHPVQHCWIALLTILFTSLSNHKDSSGSHCRLDAFQASWCGHECPPPSGFHLSLQLYFLVLLDTNSLPRCNFVFLVFTVQSITGPLIFP